MASRPDSPIEFVSAYCVGFIDGGGANIYQIRNRAAKPIKSFTVAIVNSEGTETEHSIEISSPDHYFFPGEITSSPLKEWNFSIVPLTDQLREKNGLNGEMKLIKIFMVVRVEFADGSKYDATSEYESLKTFFEKNPILMEKKGKHGRK
jgi:hypothetical protein